MEALYVSECLDCESPIQIGHVIEMRMGHWVHQVCPDQSRVTARPSCPRCFTQRSASGTCMCA